MAEELDIITRVLSGNVDAFKPLVHRYQAPVLRMIRNIVGDAHMAEDVGQDVFFTAYRQLASFDPQRGRFSTWLFTIARNQALNAARKRRPQLCGGVPEHPDTTSPADGLAEAEFFEELDRRLADLPSDQRSAFVLAEFEDLPYEDIARIEGVRPGTVKSRIHRAKAALRAALAGAVGGGR